jgi:signal transduction histidine kinase
MTKTTSTPDATGAPERVNILIVDDEPKNLMVLEAVLDDPGYRLVRASSGEEALLALIADEFAVLVLDVRMPDMTGFELALIIKERKKTARVPIIFLTAYYNEDQHVLEGYGKGAVDYLHKPVNPPVLRSKVAVFAELHRKERALAFANEALVAEVAERWRVEDKLRELNESLESRVTERTNALLASEAHLRDADRRKDEFLATLAHELHNPLAPVRNAVALLKLKGLPTPELQWASEVIERQVQAMTRLIDDVMDVSRINKGKTELRLERVPLARVLEDAIETTRMLIDEQGQELAPVIVKPHLVVDADAARLSQVFMNLLNNAAKYMDDGGRIEIGIREEPAMSGEATAAYVVVSVRDTGIGLPADRLESVFEMFSQVETALSRSRGGLGIGLTLTRRLAEMHGGTVRARSKGVGQGSEFEVRLPLEVARAQAPVPQAGLPAAQPVPSSPAQASASLRILVADDNVDAASTLAMFLELMGHVVQYVGDGEAAVQAAASFKPDVTLLDIGMPKLNGYEVCRQIREQPGGQAIFVVAVTGWGQPEDRRTSQRAGFDQHLVKPVEPAALEALIAQVLASRSADSVQP